MAGALKELLRLLRYRFLLFAGLLPYCLGAAVAFHSQGQFNFFLFFTGLVGIFFALAGVEAFNEFFDWQLGTDRVFQRELKPVTTKTFFIGIAFFFLAFLIGIFLTFKLGLAIIIFAFIGFLAAFFYLGPPLKLTYRGLGEVVIALSYGPFMMAGSYYVQSQRVDSLVIALSVIPAVLLFIISIINEVPDYLQDKLVGKRNICVRLGQKNVVQLSGVILTIFYLVLIIGLLLGKFPKFMWWFLLCVPVSLRSYSMGIKTYNKPHQFLPTIRYMILQYVIILAILITGYILDR